MTDLREKMATVISAFSLGADIVDGDGAVDAILALFAQEGLKLVAAPKREGETARVTLAEWWFENQPPYPIDKEAKP